MSTIDWRRIDVDQYDPDNQYERDELPDLKPDTSLADIGPLSQTIRGLIQRQDIASGIATLVEYAPYGSAEDVRDTYLRSVYELLTSAKMSDIPGVVKNLDLDTADVVVKFVYTLMSKEWALKQSGLFLVWLDKLTETFGEGPVIRYMSDPYKL